MRKKVFVVLNPSAGRIEVDAVRHAIKAHFQRKGWEYELYETTGEEHDQDKIKDATKRGYTYFIASGGDGTVSNVAECLVGKDIPLGILPMGTGNGIARAISIPLELDEALEVITLEGGIHNLDAMKLEDRYFFLMIGIGLSAKALRQSKVDQKRLWGRLYYILITMRTYFGFHPHRFQMEIDGVHKTTRGSEIMLLNCGTIGDPILQWAEDIRSNDGEIDIYSIRAKTIYDTFRLMWRVITGQERKDASISTFRMKHKAYIQTNKPLHVQGDGDFIQHTPVEVYVVPQAVKVLVPSSVAKGPDKRSFH